MKDLLVFLAFAAGGVIGAYQVFGPYMAWYVAALAGFAVLSWLAKTVWESIRDAERQVGYSKGYEQGRRDARGEHDA